MYIIIIVEHVLKSLALYLGKCLVNMRVSLRRACKLSMRTAKKSAAFSRVFFRVLLACDFSLLP